ncbi:uncharacterized protein LOC128126834 [Lactuca sativa]|uniref:uncharacterized protein LOC128126834 n=1 Tax=Lactuca sativa TaxID=4236 RepID=UPI0022B06BDE|nr:uncharacterized protein LOC128126834 [Lactuca sativa]
MSWAQFVERFEAQYVPKVEQQQMQQEFMALQQTTESVSDLNAKFLEILSFCPSFAGNEAWLVSRYTAILHTEIQEFVSMQEFPTLSAIMDAARRREIELQTQSKRKANDTSSKTSGDAQKKKKQGVPQITFVAPVCYYCNETGHKKPECPKLKAGKGGGGTNPAIASSSKGPTMVTRGRAHQMTADEPVITATVAGTYLLDSEPAVVMFDSGATHSFVSRTFINRLGHSIGKLARLMVVEVADNRTIYVTDVYRGCTLEFSGVEFPIDLIPIAMQELYVIVGMDWLDAFDVEIHCRKKQVRVRNPRGGELIIQGDIPCLAMVSCSSTIALDDVPIVLNFSDVFPEELPRLPPIRQMASPARLNQLQMEQVMDIFAEEFNNAFNELIPGVTNDIINQVSDLLDERLAAIPGGALPAPPVRDSAYYFEKLSKCSPPHWNGESDPVATKHWVSDVEGAFMTVGCPDQYKVVIAMNQLRKRGKTWWNTITALLNEE